MGAAPLRSRGQNFLIDPGSLDAISRAVLTRPSDVIVEIGPGLGALTRLLLKQRPVYAIEVDPAFCRYLRTALPALHLHEADALDVLESLASAPSFDASVLGQGTISEGAPGRNAALCGNLPYKITTDLLRSAVRVEWIESAVFLTQLEFADRICSGDSRSSFGIYLGCRGEFKKLRKVGRQAFFPAPSVDSALIEFTRHAAKCDPETLEKVLRSSFHTKRKKISNSWKIAAPVTGLDPDLLLSAAGECGVDSGSRPEEITPDQYYAMANVLTRQREERAR
jgi:16S rRNA (adenine1518-N6/adenine1519-N6)-dimethyltransferase